MASQLIDLNDSRLGTDTTKRLVAEELERILDIVPDDNLRKTAGIFGLNLTTMDSNRTVRAIGEVLDHLTDKLQENTPRLRGALEFLVKRLAAGSDSPVDPDHLVAVALEASA